MKNFFIDILKSKCNLKWKTNYYLFSRKVPRMQKEHREVIKKEIESNGLVCDCRVKAFEVGKGTFEKQPNDNKYFDYLECPKCKKLYYP
jgi:hypothetical protein